MAMKTMCCHQSWLVTYNMLNMIRISYSWPVSQVSKSETTLSVTVTTGGFAIWDSSLVIRDLRGHKSLEVLSHEWLRSHKSRIASDESRVAGCGTQVASRPVVTHDLESWIWLADLTSGSRIAKHAKSRVADSESRVASRQWRFVT